LSTSYLLIPHPARAFFFPTRRSSDLATTRWQPDALHSSPQAVPGFRPRGTPLGPRRPAPRRPGDTAPGAAHQRLLGVRRRRIGRSEEHTSELQSRENLVCRLLLEKKN